MDGQTDRRTSIMAIAQQFVLTNASRAKKITCRITMANGENSSKSVVWIASSYFNKNTINLLQNISKLVIKNFTKIFQKWLKWVHISYCINVTKLRHVHTCNVLTEALYTVPSDESEMQVSLTGWCMDMINEQKAIWCRMKLFWSMEAFLIKCH